MGRCQCTSSDPKRSGLKTYWLSPSAPKIKANITTFYRMRHLLTWKPIFLTCFQISMAPKRWRQSKKKVSIFTTSRSCIRIPPGSWAQLRPISWFSATQRRIFSCGKISPAKIIYWKLLGKPTLIYWEHSDSNLLECRFSITSQIIQKSLIWFTRHISMLETRTLSKKNPSVACLFSSSIRKTISISMPFSWLSSTKSQTILKWWSRCSKTFMNSVAPNKCWEISKIW